jgi:cytochrome c oxidase subunit I+III
MYALGLMGMPRRVYTYDANVGWNTLNFISTIGGYVIATSILLFVINIARSLLRGRHAGGDPWDAWTLEWATTSPPPVENFERPLPLVRSDRPLWDVKHPEHPEEAIPPDFPEPELPEPPAPRAGGESPAVRPEAAAHATLLPVAAVFAMFLIAVGLLGIWPLVAVAVVLLLGVLLAWMWKGWPEEEIPVEPGERYTPMGLGMLSFLASEIVLFGGLIFAYLHLRYHVFGWPPDGLPRLAVAFPAVNTAILIASGVAAEAAVFAYRKGRRQLTYAAFVLTIVLGAIFLGGQAWEYAHVGFGLSDGLLGSTFFTLTGLHGLHVSAGLLLLCYLVLRLVRDRHRPLGSVVSTNGMVQASTYYWHFVDVVWVVLFIVVYLL